MHTNRYTCLQYMTVLTSAITFGLGEVGGGGGGYLLSFFFSRDQLKRSGWSRLGKTGKTAANEKVTDRAVDVNKPTNPDPPQFKGTVSPDIGFY
jgi:hypothetical protein